MKFFYAGISKIVFAAIDYNISIFKYRFISGIL